MALLTRSGTGAYDLSASLTKRQDISDYLASSLYRENTTLGLTQIGEEFVDQQLNWVEDKLNPSTITDTGGQSTTATTTVSLSAADAAILDIGWLLQPSTSINTGEIYQVTALGATSATVTRGYGGTTKATTGANTVLKIIAKPTYENADLPKDFTRARVAKTNYLYRWEFGVNLSNEAIIRAKRGYTPGVRNEMAYQFKQRFNENRRELQTAFWASINATSANSTAQAGGDYSTMIGLWQWLNGTANTTAVQAATSGVFTDSTINTMAQNVLNQGGYVDTLALGSTLLGRVSQMYSDRIRLEQDERTRGFYAKYFQTLYGYEVRLVLDPVLNDNAGSYQAAMLDMGRVRLKPFADSLFFVIRAPSFRAGDALHAMSFLSLEVRNTGTDVGYSHQTAQGMS